MRKLILAFIGFLLIALPVNGLFASDAHAATSRVAIIKELKGTVKVKKAGGSKEFTAFAKMTLNEGDIVTVGGSSSAVLQFANGTDEDDKMTVSSNSKLTFSKLSTKKGTTTKVQLWSGSAWVDVKSIASSSDEFTLETPTAVMGVRGTHFIVGVDPLTGLTTATVAAGIVRTSTNTNDPKQQETKFVYPTQQVTVTNGPTTKLPSNVFISPIDLQQLISNASPDVIRSLIQSAGQINQENAEKSKQYEQQLGIDPASGLGPEALSKFKNNLDNLVGAIADRALKENKIALDELQKLIDEINKQSQGKVDLTKNKLDLTPDDNKKQEEQRKLLEELQKKKQQELEQEKLKQQQELIKKLLDKQKQLEEQRRQAMLDKQKKALEEYEKKLSEAEKKRFKDDQAKLPNNTASPTPSNSTGSGSNPSTPFAALSGLVIAKYDGLSSPTAVPDASALTVTLTPAFSAGVTQYTAQVAGNVNHVNVKPTTSGSGATVKVNNVNVSSGMYGAWLPLNVGENTITIAVNEANKLNRTYTVKITRAPSVELSGLVGEDLHLAQVDDDSYSGFVLESAEPSPLYVYPEVASAVVQVSKGATDIPKNADGSFTLSGWSEGWNTFNIVIRDPQGVLQPKTYQLNIWKLGSQSSVSQISEWYAMDDSEGNVNFTSESYFSWKFEYEPGATLLSLKPYLSDPNTFAAVGIRMADTGEVIEPDEYGYFEVSIEGNASIEATLLLDNNGTSLGIPLSFVPHYSDGLIDFQMDGETLGDLLECHYAQYEVDEEQDHVVLSPSIYNEDYIITINGNEVDNGASYTWNLETGVNVAFIYVSPGGDAPGYSYTLLIYRVAKPTGIESWFTRYSSMVEGPQEPLFWLNSGDNNYFTILPSGTGSLVMNAQLAEGYKWAIDDEEDFSDYSIIHEVYAEEASENGYAEFTLTLQDSTLGTEDYHFYVLAPGSEELKPSDVATSVSDATYKANWQNGAYSLILPDLEEGAVIDLQSMPENGSAMTYWLNDDEEWEAGTLTIEPDDTFSVYWLKVEDVAGRFAVYPVYVYNGTPLIEGAYNQYPLENSNGWMMTMGLGYEGGVDDPDQWFSSIPMPNLPIGYKIRLRNGLETFSPDEEGISIELHGSLLQTTDFIVEITDTDDNIVVTYLLKVIYGGSA